MKIAAIIATRGKPRNVIGIIESLRMLSTGENMLEFVVACDEDDVECWPTGVLAHIQHNARISVDVRPTGVGACWNRCAALTDAEVMLTLPDDGIIATPNWDHCLDWAWRNHDWTHADLKIAGLQDQANPGQPTLFAIGRRWFDMVGHLLDERYPFWFSDTAISETYSFITGVGLPMLPIQFASKGNKWNPRLRRMDLWWAHYGLTRRERLNTADIIRQTLNLPVPANLGDLIALWQKRDESGLPASEEIVRQIERPSPLDERYLEAERAAIEYVRCHGGPVFEPTKNAQHRF